MFLDIKYWSGFGNNGGGEGGGTVVERHVYHTPMALLTDRLSGHNIDMVSVTNLRINIKIIVSGLRTIWNRVLSSPDSSVFPA